MFDITRGSDESVLIQLFEDNEITPMNLSGVTALDTFESTIAPTLTVADAALGQILAVFPDEQTGVLLINGRYTFKVRIAFGATKIVTPEFVVFAR